MTVRQKILIVDDKPENLFALEQILRVLDAEIIPADSGNNALIASLNHEFALAIIDVQMPEMDGYELAELLQGQAQTRHLPIIFLSAVFHEDHYVFKGYDAGAVDFIVKPYHPKILLGKAAVFLELSRHKMETRQMALQLQQVNEALERRVLERTASLEKANQALRISKQELLALSARMLTAQEEERKRIAGELHDGIGSFLSAIKLSLEYQAESVAAPHEREFLATTIEDITQTMDEIRRIIVNLRPPVIDREGLIAALKWFQGRFQPVNASITIQQRISIAEKSIPERLKIVIFRIIQEAINNAARHNPEARICIGLGVEKQRIELDIDDDGQGFDVQSVLDGRKGLGLTSMRERVELSGGCFSLQSTIGKGTRIRACWPIHSQQDATPAESDIDAALVFSRV